MYSNPLPLQSTPNLLSNVDHGYTTFQSPPDLKAPPTPPRKSSLRFGKVDKLDAVRENEKRKAKEMNDVQLARNCLGRPISTVDDEIADTALLPWMVPVRERRFGAFPTRPPRRVHYVHEIV